MMFQGGPIYHLAPFSSHARPQKMALREHTHAADKTPDLRSHSPLTALPTLGAGPGLLVSIPES